MFSSWYVAVVNAIAGTAEAIKLHDVRITVRNPAQRMREFV